MSRWLQIGDILRINAKLYPNKEGAADLNRSLTFIQWNKRCNCLGNSLLKKGFKKGDRIAILAYNCLEWMEIYGACAKIGVIAIPIMFRFTPKEYIYIINYTKCSAFIIQKAFLEHVESIKKELSSIPINNYYYFGDSQTPNGYIHLEELFSLGSPEEPPVLINEKDIWLIMFTSGTTGYPKGVVRSHETLIAQYLTNIIALQFNHNDRGLVVMPMSHINSIFYSFIFTYIGATAIIYSNSSFNPEEMINILSQKQITFTSLVPTHYTMILNLSEEIKNKYNVNCVKKLMISSAPARRETKTNIMKFFNNSELYEAYGSTEAGLVTLLLPNEQFNKIGSIGREIPGTDLIKILDNNGKELENNEIGELYSRTPMIFNEYWKDPKKTNDSFIENYFSAGDMAYRDKDGYYYLVDRKNNMIITGGENVYPSEVEKCICNHPAVKDVAVIGIPDEKWGELVSAIIILDQNFTPSETLAQELINFTKDKIAGFKRPKHIKFIDETDMPRTSTGKIIHKILRERYEHWTQQKK